MFLRPLAAVLCLVLEMLLSAASACCETQAAGPPPAYLADAKFKTIFAEGKSLLQRHQFAFAADSFRKANKIAGGTCFDCLKGEWSAEMDGKAYKQAADTAASMEALAVGSPAKSMAQYLHAEAVYAGAGDKPKPDKLDAVHSLLQDAIASYPKNAAALFLDGKVLAQLGKMDEARLEFTQCVNCVNPNDPSRLRAEHFAENPELALRKMAPSFAITALDGSHFNLDAMGGRVVLIDFWATWCGPCNAELPHMKQIANDFAGQPLVIVSVSWDSDEEKWKNFIAQNGMTWPQYRDADHKLSDEFGVQSIPHYFTIDSDGVLTAEMVGSGSDVEGKLKKLLAKARFAGKQTAANVPTAVDASVP